MTRRLPPLGALRAFEAAARHESFAKAADELAVTPAAVSQQIRQLEADLGVTLFRRLPRGLVLTRAGRSALLQGDVATGKTLLDRAEQLARQSGASGVTAEVDRVRKAQ